MKIDEVATAPQFPMMELPASTFLYHGTDTSGDFMLPDGPAWFAFTPEQAQEWVGWSAAPPTGRSKGPGRVLVVQNYQPLSLVDTRSREVWQRFCEALTGDPEIGTGDMAAAIKQAGYAGWYGDREVMLSDPITQVYPRGIHKF